MLSKDLIEKISNNLNVKDFSSLCKALNIHDKKDIFARRFKKDFGEITYKYLSEKDKENIGETYLDIATSFVENVEELTNDIISSYGNWRKFLVPTYRDTVFDSFLIFFTKIIENVLIDIRKNFESIEDDQYLTDYIFDIIVDYKYTDDHWFGLLPPFELRDEYCWYDLLDKYTDPFVIQILNRYFRKQMDIPLKFKK